MIFTENHHLVKGLDPVADAFAGTITSDIINMKNFGHCTFIVHKGVGATGTSTFTVEACDDVAGSNVTAIPFRYREYASGDTPGPLLTATTAGFTSTAGSSKLIDIEVDASELGDTGKGYVRLKGVEVVDSPVLGGILAILSEPRYAQSIFQTAIV